MLHVLGSILAGIGSVLLILLLVLAVLILCLLFTPFFYGGRVTKQGDSLEAGAQISWLFRLLYVKVRYRDKKAETEIYILGIPLLRIRKYLSRWKKKKNSRALREQPAPAHRKPSVPPGGTPSFTADGGADAPKPEKGKKKRGRSFGKIRFTIQNFCDKIREWYRFFKSRTFKEAFRMVRDRGGRILKHIRPKKISGYVRFGMEDPASTGQLLGAAGILFPLIPEKLKLIPDFENPCLEADVTVRGRILLFVLLKNGLAVYRNRSVQKVIKKFQHKEA